MNDIIDIYEPLYRESNYTLLIVLLSCLFIGIVFGAFQIIRYLKSRKNEPTKEECYKNTLDQFLKLQKRSEKLSSNIFSSDLITIYKKYLTDLLKDDLMSATIEELIIKLRKQSLTDMDGLEKLLTNKISPALYGNQNILDEDREMAIKACVDTITLIYNREAEEDV